MLDLSEEGWDAAERGAELLREGRVEQATAVLMDLVQAQPENEHAYFYLGCAHYEAGRYPKALQAYVRALQIAPTYLGAMVHAGHALRLLGRFQEAIRMAHQILARSKDDADALYLLGLSHHARGDRAPAVSYLERFMQTRPELETALEVQALLEQLRGPTGTSSR